MDRKTAYTRTFMELLEQPIHDETIKNNYYAWWQNVRESYQARSLRLTKNGLNMLEKLEEIFSAKKAEGNLNLFDDEQFKLYHQLKKDLCLIPLNSWK